LLNQLLHQLHWISRFSQDGAPKPLVQTKSILDAMSTKTDEEKDRYEHIMEHFDLLFARVNDIGVIKQELKKELTKTKQDQKIISQQVQANGQAVASLTETNG
jgi:hypothetical protein